MQSVTEQFIDEYRYSRRAFVKRGAIWLTASALAPRIAGAAYVIKTNGSAGGLGTTPVTVTIDTTGADLIVVGSLMYNQDQTHVAITDNKGNGAPTQLTPQDSGVEGHACLYYWKNPTVGASHIFTATGDQSGGHGQAIAVASFSGSHLTAPADQQAGAVLVFSGTSPQSISAGSITPSAASLVVGVLSHYQAGVITDPASYTQLELVTGGGNPDGDLVYWIQTTATPTNPQWTLSAPTNGQSCAAVVASFKPAAAAGSRRRVSISSK